MKGGALTFREGVGLVGVVALVKKKEATVSVARKSTVYLLGLFALHFYPNIPTTIESIMEAGFAFVGTAGHVRARLAAVQDELNPAYFLVFCDQGLLALGDVKAQVEMLAELMPEFAG